MLAFHGDYLNMSTLKGKRAVPNCMAKNNDYSLSCTWVTIIDCLFYALGSLS